MSININLVSDRPNFKNFFSDGITLPERAELVMTKANLELPVIEVIATTVPLVNTVTDTALTCNLDGILVTLTWEDLYDGYVALGSVDIDATVTIDDFYSGQYELFPNYKFEMTDPAVITTRYTKLSFNKILAKALDLKYLFYNIEAEPEMIATNQQQSVDWFGAEGQINTNRGSGATFVAGNVMKELKLNATYSPQKQINSSLVAVNIQPANSVGWVIAGNQITSGATISQAWYNDGEGIDTNGGWYQVRVDMSGGSNASLMTTGFTFNGVGDIPSNDVFQATPTYEPEVIDVGIQFEKDATGNNLFKIIDGQIHNTFSHAGAITDVVTPLFKPANAKQLFQNTDTFYLQIQRGNLYNGTNEFVVNIYQGQAGLSLGHSTTRRIYTSHFTLNNASVVPNLGFMCNANGGNVFSNISHIPRSDQSIAQGNFRQVGNGGNFVGNFVIDPYLDESVNGALFGRNFWSAYGLLSFDLDGTGGTNEGRAFTSLEGKDQSLVFRRKTNFTTENSAIVYYLGKVNISDIYNTTNPFLGLQLQQFNPKATYTLPQQLVVELENLPIKAFVGSYIKPTPQAGTNAITETSGGEKRIIGTIPVPPLEQDAVSIPIQYEPFNILYRPINNNNPFLLNQIQTSIYYLDFDTNVKKSFETINGHLNIELTCRQGAKDPAMNNNLRPI
tara:strand:- start:3920 stop:5944 length:2025 start_codon:yes stop_codon:yes gene_type:complete